MHISHSQFIDLLRRSFDRAGGQAAWARRYNLSPAYVSEVNRGKRPPSEKVLAALGLVREEKTYRKVA